MVERAGLEFFPLAGNPHELDAYMIKNRGYLVPLHLRQFVEDVPRERQMIADILESTWRACTECTANAVVCASARRATTATTAAMPRIPTTISIGPCDSPGTWGASWARSSPARSTRSVCPSARPDEAGDEGG